ncbi:MAG: MipA/OmpV family protein [Gammaproteobacteria bacterium]
MNPAPVKVASGCIALMKLTLTVVAATYAGTVVGDELPLWEVGIGALPSTFPAYRGSRDQKYYVLPFPYVAYRGDILKIDRDGIRASLFHSERVRLNLSLGGSIPADSDAGGARAGMPDLDGALEIGPALEILVAAPSPRQKVEIRLPVRAVLVTDFRQVDPEGWVFTPQVAWDYDSGASGWTAGLNLGPMFANRKYHAYYYDVEPQYSTPERPAYRAKGGYSGAIVSGTASLRVGHFWIGSFLRYDNLAGAAFIDSPLVETRHSVTGGVAVAWIFATSSTMVAN